MSWILSIGLEARRHVASSLFIFAVLCGRDPSVPPVQWIYLGEIGT